VEAAAHLAEEEYQHFNPADGPPDWEALKKSFEIKAQEFAVEKKQHVDFFISLNKEKILRSAKREGDHYKAFMFSEKQPGIEEQERMIFQRAKQQAAREVLRDQAKAKKEAREKDEAEKKKKQEEDGDTEMKTPDEETKEKEEDEEEVVAGEDEEEKEEDEEEKEEEGGEEAGAGGEEDAEEVEEQE